eukprot:TRINITY_DN933_c0_g1_i7.p1 TRINITY_DN933_c0_g1~~TRINITY_DN933_c0_g1_i7.p1  ORF type:complete len:433 (+),score=120.62 TRINITY_DN933_c0_g1_i7:227-1525(+)
MRFPGLCLIALLVIEGSWVQADCRIESHPCDFPFTYEGRKFTSCTEHNATEDSTYVCVSSHGGDRWAWGVCSSQCLDEEDGTPLDFGGETMSQASSCVNEPLACVFPFVYNDVEYDKCTDVDSDFLWCASMLDDSGVMIDNMWGKCDAESCAETPIPLESPDPEEPEEEGPKNAKVSIDADGITADLAFTQESPESQLNIAGTFSGLEPGLHGIAIHSGSGENCSDLGPHFNPLDGSHGSASSEDRHAGDLGNIEVNEEGVGEINISLPLESSLFGDDDESSVLNKVLVIYAEEDPGVEGEGELTPLACGLIYEDNEWPFILILIIALSVAIVLLLILITILICCCMKRKHPKKKALDKIPEDEMLPLHNGNGSYNKKTPLYDELSIPFIDATPAPTPKLGRSIDRLSSFFTRNPSVGRSRGSLASNEEFDN